MAVCCRRTVANLTSNAPVISFKLRIRCRIRALSDGFGQSRAASVFWINQLSVPKRVSAPHVRTVLASFLFVDVVGFSKVSATEQHAFKVALISVLQRALSILLPQDYRLRDTGDGALITFLTDPEHALYVALAIADRCGRPAEGQVLTLKNLRTGINLGTVRESMDVESRPNYVGDGINAAQRIMDFAQPGQVTASRSYMEAVALLDSAYAALFVHLGARADKHGRQHELFSVTPDENVLEHLRRTLVAAGPPEPLDLDLDEPLAPRFQPSVQPVAPTPVQGLFDAGPSVSPQPAAPVPAPAAVVSGTPRLRYLLWGLLAAVLVAAASVAATRFLGASSSLPPVPPVREQAVVPAAKPEPAATVAAPASVPVVETAPPTKAASAATEAAAVPAPQAADVSPAPSPKSVPAAAPVPVPPPATQAKAVAASGRPARGAAATDTEPSPRAHRAADAAPAVAAPARSGGRCSRIMEKASLGEPLTPEEKKELASSC